MQFREVIRPPFWLLAFIYFMFLSLVIAFWAALGNQSATISFIFLTLLLILIAIKSKSEVVVSNGQLKAGGAHIDLKFLGEVKSLNRDEMRLLRTRDADPAAFLAIKFWVSTGVKITLLDQRDPTPYWLVSCKKMDELKNTLYR
jgi:ABC-type transport system involved in multi-copper enzyme maturation permease subunit